MRTKRHSQKFTGGKPSPACLHIQQQLPLFLDGELSATQAQSVLGHLSDCPVCQREREQWQQSEQALASARQYVPAPGDLRAGFYARLAANPSTRRPRPRIDWRLAVPTLAACGLAFGWLTAHRPVAAPMSELATAIPSATHQQIAQANTSPTENLAVTNANTGSSLPRATSNSKSAEHAVTRASSFTQIVSQGTRNGLHKRRGLPKRSGWQIALFDLRQNPPAHSNWLKTRPRALAASLVFAYQSAKPANLSDGRLTEKQLARSKDSSEASNLFADAQTEMNESLNLSKASLKKKAAVQSDNFGMMEARNGVQAAKRSDYAASGLSSQNFGELKEQTALSVAKPLAAADPLQTFALSFNGSARQDTNVLQRGLSLQFTASENEGVDLQVRDSKRGFTNGTRLAGEVQEQNGRRVLIIQAEDAEPPADEASE